MSPLHLQLAAEECDDPKLERDGLACAMTASRSRPRTDSAPRHCSRVFASPWTGVYSTYIDSAVHFSRHWHDAYGFGVMEDGAHRSSSGRGSVDAYAGDVITTNPGEVHDGRPHGCESRRWRIVCMDCETMSSIVGACPSLTRPVLTDPALARALRALFRRLERRADPLACDESLVESCVLLVEHHGAMRDAAHMPDDLRRVRERLADELLDPPSLADLAEMAGLSRYQLLRRFERAYGLPPHAWLLRQRAERARVLIRGGSGLAAAAAASGFADQSHMTRVFGRHFGFTPGEWRKALALQ